MSNTLWAKGKSATEYVDSFTVGQDRILDLRLAQYDVLGSKAHIKMLKSIELLPENEEAILQEELNNILKEIENGEFILEDTVEDIHSQVELLLTRRLGDIGKKIHSGRSRNDQVLVDIKLFLKDELLSIKGKILELFDKLQDLSETHKKVLLPGYTHGQIAMPSSFGLWFGAYAEALTDDLIMLDAAFKIVDQNPLGSAAGYGSSFPLDREMTTKELGFGTMVYNSIAAQLSRGRAEKSVSFAISSVASTLNKLATDCCQYMCQNYGFISFPDELTTGSSIMPHKKNPDVWELIRGNCNRLQSIPNEIALLCTNLPHGYHRDFQLLKEILFPAIEMIVTCLEMTSYMLSHIKVNPHILDDEKYNYIFTVEEVNSLVLAGVPFRDAYKKIGLKVETNQFVPNKVVKHTHHGSIGKLCNEEIKKKI